MMFTPHQADAVRRALRKGLDQEGPPSQGLDGRLRDALADTGRARFTADQKDDVRSALRTEGASDVVLLVGREARSCLLYTSPSPRDRQKTRMPSSA